MNKTTYTNKMVLRGKEVIINIQSKNYPSIVEMALCAGAYAQLGATFRAAINDKNMRAKLTP